MDWRWLIVAAIPIVGGVVVVERAIRDFETRHAQPAPIFDRGAAIGSAIIFQSGDLVACSDGLQSWPAHISDDGSIYCRIADKYTPSPSGTWRTISGSDGGQGGSGVGILIGAPNVAPQEAR